ncbi:MAG TPA: hypothetical protein VGP28_02970 [Methylocella sp.]|jgi:hypothetical protein|nr:hypothetical protein [Methylocella sp.]
MTRGIPKKRQRGEQLRKKRLQAAPARAAAAETKRNGAHGRLEVLAHEHS